MAKRKEVSPAQAAARKRAWELFVIEGAAKNLEGLGLPELEPHILSLREAAQTHRKKL